MHKKGFTLIELMVGAVLLAVAITALLGAFLGQITLNEHSRNLPWAVNDANRVMERLRQANSGSGCSTPSIAAPTTGCLVNPCASWDVWLDSQEVGGGGGKSIQPNPNANELIVVSQGSGDPLPITVAVCWRHRGRTIGECASTGVLAADDAGSGDGDGTVESPAMLSTLMTCRR